ncbi:heavy metal translocating P-type ATPase [Ornithinibacillus halophilus]|uniref:Cd(2+)-exporting ATPase n=1 Tax=Ornithinibacillus halophilus TaxID=930117 RepID=A0A1M5IXI6_9BACI|nr:heavy metal translocating P-type ATPase [Ornithinibacillus halophilus]SHG32769.1 Cd2+/Zn2+-exporting ATPase [Ornithinibacillus halophilus]
MQDNSQQKVFQVQGISCANCAKTFEKNIQRMEGVREAEVNFAASKVTVLGEATANDIEKAGAFENIKVVHDDLEDTGKKEPFFIRYDRLILASILIIFGIVAINLFDGSHYLTILPFALSILIGGIKLLRAGLVNLTRLQFDMKTLMTIAVIGAAIIGEWMEAAIVVILFAISEELETYSMDKARASIRSLMSIAPKAATIIRNGQEQKLHIKDILIGDIMLVKPGEKLAMDGVVIKGTSSINQAPITGESIPAEKHINDVVYAGTINQNGFLEVKVTKRSEDTTIAKIIHLVEEAQGERAPSQAFVDRFAAYYTPIIMGIALLVAITPPLFFGGLWETWVYQGLAVLVVGCPCALVISTPVAIVTAIGTAAKNGVLVKGGVYLEQIGALKAIAFDKTGTLTEGKPVVTDIKFFKDNQEETLQILAALESKSQHPLAEAIINEVQNRNISYQHLVINNFEAIQGKGIQGEINGKQYYLGTPKLFNTIEDDIENVIHRFQQSGKTIMILGTDQEIFAFVALRDEPRDESKNVIQHLHQLGIHHSVILSGDHPETARALGKELAVTEVKGGLLPEDKLQYIKNYQNQYGNIAMIGDGMNDTPALATSNVGIAMGTAGTDSALETADVALMGDDLRKLPFTVKLSRKALSIIKQNITFSIGIKLFALLLVIPGWLTLWIAIFADMGATLLVTLNALRLLNVKE